MIIGRAAIANDGSRSKIVWWRCISEIECYGPTIPVSYSVFSCARGCEQWTAEGVSAQARQIWATPFPTSPASEELTVPFILDGGLQP